MLQTMLVTENNKNPEHPFWFCCGKEADFHCNTCYKVFKS